jgi:hypothetical protein
MSLGKKYRDAVSGQLNRHAVWEPGDPIATGDYGRLDEKGFLKLGHIREFDVGVEPVIEHSEPKLFEFTSKGTTVARAEASTPDTISDIASAALKIAFTEADSIYLRADHTVTSAISNLREVANALRLTSRWEYGWLVVNGVTTARRLSVVLSDKEGAEIVVRGSVNLLNAFQAGTVQAGAGLAVEGDTAYKAIGTSGPFLCDLVRLRRFLGGTARAALPGSLVVEPYEAVLPLVPQR